MKYPESRWERKEALPLPGLIASRVPVTGGRRDAQVLEEQGRGRGRGPRPWVPGLHQLGVGRGSISINHQTSAARPRPPALWPSNVQRPGTRQALDSGIRAFGRTVKQTKSGPPQPVAPDCQAPGQKRVMVSCFLRPWRILQGRARDRARSTFGCQREEILPSSPAWLCV